MRHTCPTCDEEFDTRRGLGVHHSHVHDERLSNRECANCGDEFYCEYEKKYCSETCHGEAVSYEGESNPNFQDKKEVAECSLCGTEFEYYESSKVGLYCSDCVEQKSWRPIRDIQGSKNPRWNGGKIELECAVCDSTVERYPSNVTGETTVCSEECRTEWLSEAFAESGHPNWKGGGNGSYGKGWNAVRRKALERDGYECVVCSKSRDEIGRNPDIHHIVPVRSFVESSNRDKTDAHFLGNVVSLCIGCHRKADFGKIPKSELRERIDSARTASSAAL
ncbi:HNH endonuclease [Halorussus caseinilyticus]|uniref:HNH endonuclease n=1 Tax=Halorussus caseinilyticus TaxID=3034025 RepID=UPI0023E82FC9|nr:HNH endonuclease [Halorussus sp. DT72]